MAAGGSGAAPLTGALTMALDRISLSRFRNHRETTLEGARGFNLLVGENGAGKTNVLEALSLLAPGRGLRRAALTEMASAAGDGGFAVGASLGTDEVRLGTLVDPVRPTRRLVRINGAEASAVARARTPQSAMSSITAAPSIKLANRV